MKIVYIIPGYTEQTTMPSYQKVMELFREQNFHPISVTIAWKRNTMSTYVQEFLKQANQHQEVDEVYLFGFSFGAIIAFLASPIIKPKAQLLCSLSPYFQEDLALIKNWWKVMLGRNRMKDFQTISCVETARLIQSKTILLAGSEEGEHIERRAREVHNYLKGSKLTFIPGAKHDISQPIYVQAIQHAISQL